MEIHIWDRQRAWTLTNWDTDIQADKVPCRGTYLAYTSHRALCDKVAHIFFNLFKDFIDDIFSVLDDAIVNIRRLW